MPDRYHRSSNRDVPKPRPRLFSALRNSFKDAYSGKDLMTDVMSGLVVALIAVPLAMALAIASGVAPQHGLYTVIIGGLIVALLGGSRFQVTGPTAAFVVILLPIVQKYGLSGLLISGFMAGLILVAMGYARLGQLIQYIPHPVTTGFTSGIALVIAVLQIKDFFGIQLTQLPESFFEKLMALGQSFGTFSFTELSVSLMTLAILLMWPKVSKRIPSPLAALTIITVGCVVLAKIWPEFEIATIGSRFVSGIPQALPTFRWPWGSIGSMPGEVGLNLETIRLLLPSAFAIAMLGAIESLLSAVVADGMTQTKHDPDSELIALGIGNMICPFFGGIPATGAIARTATNIRFGAKTPISSIAHALFTLLTVLLFAPYISYLPMAALSAFLIVVAYNMSEYRHFANIVKVAPKSDVIVLLICFFLTVVFDMVIGVSVGVAMAALLFIKRMAEVTQGYTLEVDKEMNMGAMSLPSNVMMYEIEGPMFFGAAEKAAGALFNVKNGFDGVIYVLHKVPVMDMTGLVALEGAIGKLRQKNKRIYLVGLQEQPKALIMKSILKRNPKDVFICKNIETAIAQEKENQKK